MGCNVSLIDGHIDEYETSKPQDSRERTRQKLIDTVKVCAEEIIQNAESIIGTEPWLRCVTISINLNPGEMATITVTKDIYPDIDKIEKIHHKYY